MFLRFYKISTKYFAISILQFNGQELLYLEDRHGVPQPLPSLGNNLCNNKSPTLLQDVGKIEDLKVLPITAIIYGQNVFEGEVAKATIGPLVCIEKHQKSFQEQTILSQNETKEAIQELVEKNNILTSKVDTHTLQSDSKLDNVENLVRNKVIY